MLEPQHAESYRLLIPNRKKPIGWQFSIIGAG